MTAAPTNTLTFAWLLLCLIHLVLSSKVHGEQSKQNIIKQVKSFFNIFDIVGNIKHIQEDLASSYNMENLVQISLEDTAFYFHRMHDYDGNKKLDGIELLQSLRHSKEHSEFAGDITEEAMEEYIDSFMLYDGDNDGFLTYAEFKKRWIASKEEKAKSQSAKIR